jgi:mannose-6-phosphate isomerase class I
VLRGGLTKKHVDIPELLNNVVFREEAPQILTASKLGPGEWAYRAPAKEFELRRIEGGHVNTGDHGPEILFVTEGEGTVAEHLVSRGQALFVPEGETYHVKGSLVLYKATVPR